MNSLIQCLYYIKDFRNYFLTNKFKSSQIICLSLKEIFGKLYYSNDENCNPIKILNEINKNKLFNFRRAADASDLLDFFLDSIMEELNEEESICETIIYEERFYDKNAMFKEAYKGIDFNLVINKLFIGFYEREFKCLKEHKKYSFVAETKIIFPLEQIYKSINKKENFNIYDCFNYYERKQNGSEIGKCNCGEDYILTEKIYRSPEILILILERGDNKAFKQKIEFPEYLDLTKYINDKSYGYPYKYKLIGVSSHLGYSGQFGHYISFCLCDDNNYYYFNDAQVERINNGNKNSIQNLYKGSPYILFYQKLTKNEKIINHFYDDILNINIYNNISKQNDFNNVNKNINNSNYLYNKINLSNLKKSNIQIKKTRPIGSFNSLIKKNKPIENPLIKSITDLKEIFEKNIINKFIIMNCKKNQSNIIIWENKENKLNITVKDNVNHFSIKFEQNLRKAFDCKNLYYYDVISINEYKIYKTMENLKTNFIVFFVDEIKKFI